MSTEFSYFAPSPIQVGIKACCPRCGQGKLYDGLLQPAKQCIACRLDFAFIDSGDGPAVFVILIIGFIITAMALALQTSLNSPIWLQVLIWIPIIVILCMWGLRFAKGVMISLQYQTKAKEGELGNEND